MTLKVLLAAAFAAGSVFAGLDNPHATKKMIAIGWDISPRVAEDLIRHQDEIAAMGFDGVGLSAACPELEKNGKPRTWGSAVYGKYGVGDPEKFFAIAEPLRKLNAGPLKHNFVSFTLFFAKRNRWEDDEFWKFSCEKAAAFARLAKLGGCRGVLMDTEDYGNSGQFYYNPGFEKQDYKTAAEHARQRGRELMEAMVKEFPDMEILTTWLLSNQSRSSYQDTWNGGLVRAEKSGDAFVPFMQGLVEGLGPETTLIDGNEAGYYCEATHREFFYDYFAIRNLGRALMTEDLWDKYNRQVRVGFGLYIDSYTLPEKNGWSKGKMEGSRLKHYELNLRQALEATDKYVWIWGEHYAYADWKDAFSKHHSEQPTWETALPGVRIMQNFVKDPKGYGEKLWKELLACGTKPKNIVMEGAGAGRWSVSNRADQVGTTVSGIRPCWGRDRKDGPKPAFEYVKEGHGGKPGVRMSGAFAGGFDICGLRDLDSHYGAIYRASLWFKTSDGPYAMHPEFSYWKVTKDHPLWNKCGGWMGQHFLHDDGNAVIVYPGEADKDGWREAVVYFRSEPFDRYADLRVRLPRRMYDGEYLIVSDPQIVMIKDPKEVE